MRLHRSAALLASLALTACAHARQADVSLPVAYEAKPTANPAPADMPIDRWWTNFSDPQLDALIEHALAANPDARSAAARLTEARAAAASSLTAFLPQGDLHAARTDTHSNQLQGPSISLPGFSSSGTSQQSSANLNVSWEIDLFGRIFGAARAARGDIAAARFDEEATHWSLAAQVADAYFQARGLAIQLSDSREAQRIEQELYDVADKRAKAGLAPSADADRIAGDLAVAKSNYAALEAQLQSERRQVLILAGRPIDPTASVAIVDNVGRAPAIPATLPSQLLERRPDVREAQARIESASGRLLLQDLAFFPTFNLTPGLGWTKYVAPSLTLESDSWSIGGTAMQPIFSIPKLLQDLKVQNARTEEAVLAYEKSVQTAFGEAETSLVALEADERRVDILVDGEARARRAYDAARLGYERGLTDLNTVANAEQTWRTTRIQLTNAQVQSVRQAVAAYKAIGGGWPAASYPMTDHGH
jgi:NodT family efflux transporter outer membrane factor (OMF) lipoprotein